MELTRNTGSNGSFMGRSVFQNDKFVPNKEAEELLKKYPTKDMQAEQKIDVTIKRYFRFNIAGEDLDKKLAGAKAVNGYFKQDDASKQWLFITSGFSLKTGTLMVNSENKFIAINEAAELLVAATAQHGIDGALALQKSGLL
jgi:hypothetical protein